MSQKIQNNELLKAIETAIPATEIEKALSRSKANKERNRSLPPQLMVYLVVAMSLWSKDSMRDVLKNLIDGMSERWVHVGKYWRVPSRSAITQARPKIRGRSNEKTIPSISQTNGY